MIIETVIFSVTFLLAYFLYNQRRVHKHLKNAGIKFIPGMPLYGNSYGTINQEKHMVEEILEIYNAFPNERYVGFIEGSTPIIIIRDPEITKEITVKHFDHFVDHRDFFPAGDDIFGKSLFSMKGNAWRDMRTTLSPAFTGSKMRLMMPSMVEVTKNVIEFLKEQPDEVIDVDDVMRRYANDVIASAGFGLQVNSFEDKDNEFFKIGQSLFKFTFWQNMTMLINVHCPYLAKKIGIKLFPEKTNKFFKHIISSTMEHREKHNIERPDMIQLLMEASRGTLKPAQQSEEHDVGFATAEESLKHQGEIRKWSLEDLAGQVFIFFTAGFETSASSMVMCLHELALNPQIQDKLYEEIKSFSDKNKLSYETIGQMKYLDCVLNETLRKWSAAIVMDRMCVKPYELPPPRRGGKPYMLKPGEVVYNMVNAIHLDPKYYPEPLVFRPERFSEENRHNIAPFTFMPFGMGPRICIGSRFALLEVKLLIYQLILNFEVKKCEKTMDPIVLKPEGFNITASEGSYVKFEPRK